VIAAFTSGWWVAYGLYGVLLAGTVAERMLELVVSARNARWAFERGGRESGRAHFPPMVALHTGLIAACALEPVLAGRPFIPALAVPAAVLALAAQGLRWWCIATLGPQWNTRVVVVPGAGRISSGPYRYLRHPNYVAVVAEGIALPLVHTAWLTAVIFSVLNAALLRVRIHSEAGALAMLGQA
jgi:methyltransferase